MAKETKFIEVEPSTTEETIELWQKFGWELVGAPQEVLSQTSGTSHLERRGDDIYQVTTSGTTTHYVKITFQREKNMPNYAELVRLEEAYYTESYAKPDKPLPSKPSLESAGGFSSVSGFISIIIGILCMCGDSTAKGLGVIFLVIGVALAIFGGIASKNKDSQNKPLLDDWVTECDAIKNENNKIQCENEERRQELLRKAESLLT